MSRASVTRSIRRSACGAWVALAGGALVIVGCVSPDAFFRDGGALPPDGAGGSIFGVGGQLGSGGSGLGGVSGVGGRTGIGGAGVGGTTGAGGRTGVGGSGTGGTPGVGGSGVGGRVGTGGSGTGGAPAGVGGSGAGGAIGVGGGPGVDAGMGAGGTIVTGCPPGVYCADFEADTIGQMPVGWSRVGGSAGDWEVTTDPVSGKSFAQDHAQSSTYRIGFAGGVAGSPAPLGGATTLSAQVRILLAGSSAPTTALVCLRYATGSDAYCLALLAGMGAQIQARNGQTISGSGTLLSTTVAIGTAYNVQLSISAGGVVSASIGGATVPAFTPATVTASGTVAVATQNAEASFDNIVVSQP